MKLRKSVAAVELIWTFGLLANFAGLIAYAWNELISSVFPPGAVAALSRVTILRLLGAADPPAQVALVRHWYVPRSVNT